MIDMFLKLLNVYGDNGANGTIVNTFFPVILVPSLFSASFTLR